MRDLLLDTNTPNYILKERQPPVSRLREAKEEGCRFLLGSMVHYELTRYLELKGAHRLLRLYRRLVEPWLRCDLTFADWNAASLLCPSFIALEGRSRTLISCSPPSPANMGQSW